MARKREAKAKNNKAKERLGLAQYEKYTADVCTNMQHKSKTESHNAQK